MITMLKARALRAATNIRQSISTESLEEMKSSILASGVIQNLVVAQSKEGPAVIAGITRLSAVHALQDENKLPADYAVPVLMRDDIDADSVDAIAIAMTENMIRSEMDFVDECLAMLKLAKGGKQEGDIAALFGYRTRTVRERLLIAQVVPEALDVVRNGTRNLDWARALTMADVALQTRIVEDVLSNPSAWRTADDIRTYLTKATIPASLAIFDLNEYTGPVIQDFFDGDKLADGKQFWDLQNAAVAEHQANLEAEGYAVTVLRGTPFPEWLYEDANTGDIAEAIIEVLASGAVRVIRDKVRIEGMDTSVDGPSLAMEDGVHDTLAAHEVRPTNRVLDYARHNRSVMVQQKVAQDFDLALRTSVLTMLGVTGAATPTAPITLNSEALTSNTARMVMNDVNASVRGVANTEDLSANDSVISMVMSMDRATLEPLFAGLVAQRTGQTRAAMDDSHSLTTLLGTDIDVRAFWTPEEAFFNLMATEDLRRLALALVPNMRPGKIASIKRKTLVRQLTRAFEDAKNGVLNGPDAKRLNTWVPGVMNFPAVLDTIDQVQETLEDVESLIFT